MYNQTEDKPKVFQQLLSKGGNVFVKDGELVGDFVIKKPTVLKPQFGIATLVGSLEIKNSDVTIENMIFSSGKDSQICLKVGKKIEPEFKNVVVRGQTDGFGKDDKEWKYPAKLEIKLPQDSKVTKRIIISVPVECNVSLSDIANIQLLTKKLQEGENEIIFVFNDTGKGVLFQADLFIESKTTGLLRKFPITATSFDDHLNDKSLLSDIIWSYKPLEVKPDFTKLQKVYFARQGEPFKMTIKLQDLKIKDYKVGVEKLPSGFSCSCDTTHLIIEGTCQEAGEFISAFKFNKNLENYEFETKFIIEKKPVVEIKAELFDITTKENERINQRIKVTQSNTTKIRFKEVQTLPNGLFLNQLTGEIYGEICEHGLITFPVIISDEVTEKEVIAKILILPADQLRLDDSCKKIQCFKNEPVNITLFAKDQDQLLATIEIEQNPTSLVFKQSQSGYHLEGSLNSVGLHKLKFKIRDLYNRVNYDSVEVHVIEKPLIEVLWSPQSPIQCKGKRKSKYEQKITARLKDKSYASLTYFIVDNPHPEVISLAHDGTLSITIREGTDYYIEIGVDYQGQRFSKEYQIQTIVQTESLNISGKELGNAFRNEESKTFNKHNLTKDAFLDHLPEGKVGIAYNTIITKNGQSLNNNLLQLIGIPPGLSFDQQNNSIKGIPLTKGTYQIQINNEYGSQIHKLDIQINGKSAFESAVIPTVETENQSTSKDKKKFSPGKAFNI